MLTSASQYLHPDYLQPLPTTLDAKKSPLALLAQTCSSIGKDTTPSKSIIPPLEKPSKDSSKENNNTSSSNSNNGSKPSTPKAEDVKSEKREGSSPSSDSGKSGSFRAPAAPKDIPPLVPITSSAGDRSPAPGDSRSASGDRDRHSPATSGNTNTPARSPSASAGVNSSSRISLSCGNMLLEVNHQESALAAAKVSACRPEMPSAIHPSLAAYPHLGLGHSIDALTASSLASHHSSLAAHGLAGRSAAAAGGQAISPYSYARVKTSAGATTLVPICRDPYCTNCQITVQNAQFTSACAAGCTQCNHEKGSLSVPTSLSAGHSSLGHLGGSVPILPFPATSLPPSAGSTSALHMASSLYPHAFGILPGHHSLPYVCNWMAGSEYCGKRFSNSEELLQHLRTHTSSSEAALSGLSAAYGLAGFSPAAAALAGCHSYLPTPPASLSPNSLRQAYPRSLSPNSLLAARYHPYKHLSALPPAPAAPSGLPSALSAYYSPYALYGQRLGAAVP